MQEQRDRLSIDLCELRGQPVELLGFASKSRIHDQRIQSDKAPAGGLEGPAVLADNGQKRLAVFLGGRMCRRSADRGRIVSDIVIAGQVDAVDRKRRMQLLGEFEIVAVGRRVEGDIAGVDDEVGARRVDVLADALEIPGELLIAAGEVGIGNLGQTKFAHAIFLPAGSYMRPGEGIMTVSEMPHPHRHTPRMRGIQYAAASRIQMSSLEYWIARPSAQLRTRRTMTAVLIGAIGRIEIAAIPATWSR